MFGTGEARRELFDYIYNLSDKKAAIRHNHEEWSVLDILEHLYVIEKVMTAEIKEILEKNDKKESVRHKTLDSTLDRSNKFKAPKNLMPKKELISLSEAKEKLVASRYSLLKVLEEYNISDLESHSGRHPAFGTLSVGQWIEFIGLHEKRHLAQMKEIVKLS